MDRSCFGVVSLELLAGQCLCEWTSQQHQAGSSGECVSLTKKTHFLNFRIDKKHKFINEGPITKARFKRKKKTLKFIYYMPHRTGEFSKGNDNSKDS